MFQPTTEHVNSLTIDDVAWQAVPESGTGRTECSVAHSRKLHSRYLQSMSPRWSEPMPARHVGDTDKVVGQVLWSQSVQWSEDQHLQLELYALMGRAQPVKAGERLSDVVTDVIDIRPSQWLKDSMTISWPEQRSAVFTKVVINYYWGSSIHRKMNAACVLEKPDENHAYFQDSSGTKEESIES